MGMYTELIFGAELKESTSNDIIESLRYFIGESDVIPSFRLSGGRRLCRGSYYFGVNRPVNKMWFDDISKTYHVSIRCNLKNYQGEIQEFLEWIEPYIESGSGEREMYAIVMYEEDYEPKIYYLYD